MKQLEAICKAAQGELGIKEDPPDSNCVKYNTWYYGRAVSGGEYAWCMVFMQWLANKIGLSVYRTASCSVLATWAKQQKQWVTQDFQKGDWVEFDFSGKRKVTQHVGLVVGLYPGGVITIEGEAETMPTAVRCSSASGPCASSPARGAHPIKTQARRNLI